MKYIWIAEVKFGKPHISRIAVKRETEKMYYLGDADSITGYTSKMRQISKTDYRVYQSGHDAVSAMIDKLRSHRESLSARIDETSNLIAALIDLLKDE